MYNEMYMDVTPFPQGC